VRRGSFAGRSKAVAAALAVLLPASVLLGGCGLLGSPRPPTADAPIKLTVTSPVVSQGMLPARFTCHGVGKSPPIFWSGAPPGTKSFALVIDDSDAPIAPQIYWIVFDIGPYTTYIQGNTLPLHARLAQNSIGKAGYDPPCPQGARHFYRFTVYALNTSLGKALPENPPLLETWTDIARHVIGRGTMTVQACPNRLPPSGSQCASASSRT
jgi:Raf kinase inhibitor-like YbhB/YbcL family protein